METDEIEGNVGCAETCRFLVLIGEHSDKRAGEGREGEEGSEGEEEVR